MNGKPGAFNLNLPDWGARILYGFGPFLAVALIWWVLVHVVRVRPVFLPPLEDLPAALWSMFAKEGMGRDILDRKSVV